MSRTIHTPLVSVVAAAIIWAVSTTAIAQDDGQRQQDQGQQSAQDAQDAQDAQNREQQRERQQREAQRQRIQDQRDREQQVRRQDDEEARRQRDEDRRQEWQRQQDRERIRDDDRRRQQRGDQPAGLGVSVISSREGVEVVRVAPNSPADEAGIQQGDEILAVNDRSIRSGQELVQVVRSQDPGQRAEITILRDGREQTISARLEPRQEALQFRGSDRGYQGGEQSFYRGGPPRWEDHVLQHVHSLERQARQIRAEIEDLRRMLENNPAQRQFDDRQSQDPRVRYDERQTQYDDRRSQQYDDRQQARDRERQFREEDQDQREREQRDRYPEQNQE